MPNWLHAPSHNLPETGAYMVTAGTYKKAAYLGSPERLTLVRDRLFDLASEYGWQLQAWAILSNHYHFVALSPPDPSSLSEMLKELHSSTASELNRLDGTPGRRVWFQFWDTHLTFQRSYFARLNYVHQNPVKHGLVAVATTYPWCSAAWFESRASRSFARLIGSFKTDRVNVPDGFDG